jgi:hypothetical protein
MAEGCIEGAACFDTALRLTAQHLLSKNGGYDKKLTNPLRVYAFDYNRSLYDYICKPQNRMQKKGGPKAAL